MTFWCSLVVNCSSSRWFTESWTQHFVLKTLTVHGSRVRLLESDNLTRVSVSKRLLICDYFLFFQTCWRSPTCGLSSPSCTHSETTCWTLGWRSRRNITMPSMTWWSEETASVMDMRLNAPLLREQARPWKAWWVFCLSASSVHVFSLQFSFNCFWVCNDY